MKLAVRMALLVGAAFAACAGLLFAQQAVRSDSPQASAPAASQPAVRSDSPQAVRPGSPQASAAGPQDLEQARDVFRQFMGGELTEADRTRIGKLITQLGSDNWKDRDEAQKALSSESAAALPQIRRAAAGNDTEAARRAKSALAAVESRNADRAVALRKAIVARQAAGDAAVVGDVIALLSYDDPAVLGVAGWGLPRLTGQDFGYAAAEQDKRAAAAAQKARDWWEANKATFILKAPVGPETETFLDLGGGIELKLVLIPAGKFMMGSRADEKDYNKERGPQHEVTITKPFYMGAYDVTQEQYERIMGVNPSSFKGAQNPVEMVSWAEAAEFCEKLSQKTGRTVSLPTEAQWEYACRAGSTTRFSYGDDDGSLSEYAWHAENSGGMTHPVGRKKPNAWGLYDMHGQVWQWCSDWWADSYASAGNADPSGPATGKGHVMRGGCWLNRAFSCFSAFRSWDPSNMRYNTVGFRVIVDAK